MSDFISRVAARAVGRAAVTQPRLPSVFEPAAPSPLEAVAEQPATPAEASEPAPAPPAARPHARTAPRGEKARADVESPPVDPTRPVLVPAREAAIARARDPVAVAPERRETPAPAAPLAATTVARPARRAAPVAPAPRAAAAVAQAEPPAVRVHIGRLEVRANLQQQPPRSEPRSAPAPRELSLGDYLRGRRGSP